MDREGNFHLAPPVDYKKCSRPSASLPLGSGGGIRYGLLGNPIELLDRQGGSRGTHLSR
jgi:hypothetical protein